MISLLSKLFIKNRGDYSDTAVRRAYGMLCGIVGISLNVFLFALKLIAGTLSGAISVTADAFNNLSDAGSSVITLIGFKLAGQKPDTEHPFGHGRMEYISGLIVSMIIIVVGFELARTSFDKITSPEPTEFSYLTVGILTVSILIKLYMSLYNTRIGKKITSAAMKATATDSLSDCVATAAVLICTVLSGFTTVNLDAYCGLAVSLFIMYAGLRAAIETISPLLGEPPSKEFVEKIEKIVMSHDDIQGIHDLVVHDYGPGRMMISLHAEVPSSSDILYMHDIIDNIERELRDTLSCDAVIHMDPIDTDDDTVNELRHTVSEIVASIDSTMTIHDFRIVKGASHTNLIFDMVVPFSVKIPENELKQHVCDKIGKLGNYYAVISIDKSLIK